MENLISLREFYKKYNLDKKGFNLHRNIDKRGIQLHTRKNGYLVCFENRNINSQSELDYINQKYGVYVHFVNSSHGEINWDIRKCVIINNKRIEKPTLGYFACEPLEEKEAFELVMYLNDLLPENRNTTHREIKEKIVLKPKDKEINKLNEEQEEEDERDLYEGNFEFKNNFEYEPKPENKKIIKKEHTKREGVIPRDQQKRLNALARANYKCEINPNHETFKSKQGFRYMETHHLIPMQYYDDFGNSIDVEANLVCLCSNCHNEIHYGKDGDLLVLELFEKRKEELKKAGIGDIDEDSLINLYK